MLAVSCSLLVMVPSCGKGCVSGSNSIIGSDPSAFDDLTPDEVYYRLPHPFKRAAQELISDAGASELILPLWLSNH